MKMKKLYTKKVFLTVFVFVTLILSACDSGNADITAISPTSDTTLSSVQTTAPETGIKESENETAALTAYQSLIDAAEIPQIVITESSGEKEILQAGKTAGIFYSKAAEKYFGYGANNNWKYDFDEDLVSYRCYGLYTDETYTSFAPIDYTELKKVITKDLKLTEKGFEELNANSPNRYYDVNGFLCMTPGEGGQAGWDYSYIIDYEMGVNTITYNCARVGRKECWGYDEDLIKPFTFRLALEDGVWKLDGCSYGEGLFYWFIGLENDIETYTASVSEQTNENNTEIIAEIKQTLAEFKEFSYSYLQCKAYMFGENLDTNDKITADGTVYYRTVSGDYTSYSELMSAIDRYCSEEVISECNLKEYSYYEGENDSLYISEGANSNGGVMGSDAAYITSIEPLDDGSVKVNMTAWGDKDEWGYKDGDSVIPFEITMTSENGLWKIDKCGLMEMDYITWLFDADY